MESTYGGLKLSKTVIFPVQKCLKYAVAKNAGEKKRLQENLNALWNYLQC